MNKKPIRLGANGKPYAGVLSEFVQLDDSKYLDKPQSVEFDGFVQEQAEVVPKIPKKKKGKSQKKLHSL